MILSDQNNYMFRAGVPIIWDDARWPNFSRAELSCRHCGEYFHDTDFLDGLQSLRTLIRAPINILSAHRCSLHNAAIGGAPLSQHLTMAADIRLHPHDPLRLRAAAHAAGFTGLGYYTSFLHIDKGRPRFWYGSQKARQIWQTLLA